MCLNLKYIPNRSKIISPYHRERLLVPVKCGYCSECQREKMNEWNFRIYHEWLDTFNKGGYVFFDTFTYDNEHLPMFSRHFGDLVKDIDSSCFDRSDIRKLLTNLNTDLRADGIIDDIHRVRHFIAAEYGTDQRYTHRPHYHALFFVTAPIEVEELRDRLHSIWSCGRTDKVRRFGSHANVFYPNNTGQYSKLAVSNYVAKYVQKSSSFQKVIDKRVAAVINEAIFDYCVSHDIELDCYDVGGYPLYRIKDIVNNDVVSSYVSSESFKSFYRSVVRQVQQFHVQSKGFGASYLDSCDVDSLIENQYLIMPDVQKIVKKIALPKYYERKLFERQVKWHGKRIWEKTSLGLKFKRNRESKILDYVANKYECMSAMFNLHRSVDFKSLAQYIVHYKGRYKLVASRGDDVVFSDKLKMPNKIFAFVTPSDRQKFHDIGYSLDDCSSSARLTRYYPARFFLSRNSIDDTFLSEFNGFDSVISDFDKRCSVRQFGKQLAFDIRQTMENRKKMLENVA